MSYCRWSSDDFDCDVYVYADVRGGWSTHVAGRRVVYKAPLPPEVALPARSDPTYDEAFEAWFERHRKVKAMRDEADLVEIGLPHDGETFSDETPGLCADRLEYLRVLGYHVPQYAIDELRTEGER